MPKRTGIALLVVCLLAIVVLLILHCVLTRQSGQMATAWQHRIEQAAEVGVSRERVTEILGTPDEVLDMSSINKYARPELTPPPGTTSILVYTFTHGIVNIWVAYIFLDREGEVLGHEIRQT